VLLDKAVDRVMARLNEQYQRALEEMRKINCHLDELVTIVKEMRDAKPHKKYRKD
jgi:hypothetical protein